MSFSSYDYDDYIPLREEPENQVVIPLSEFLHANPQPTVALWMDYINRLPNRLSRLPEISIQGGWKNIVEYIAEEKLPINEKNKLFLALVGRSQHADLYIVKTPRVEVLISLLNHSIFNDILENISNDFINTMRIINCCLEIDFYSNRFKTSPSKSFWEQHKETYLNFVNRINQIITHNLMQGQITLTDVVRRRLNSYRNIPLLTRLAPFIAYFKQSDDNLNHWHQFCRSYILFSFGQEKPNRDTIEFFKQTISTLTNPKIIMQRYFLLEQSAEGNIKDFIKLNLLKVAKEKILQLAKNDPSILNSEDVIKFLDKHRQTGLFYFFNCFRHTESYHAMMALKKTNNTTGTARILK